MVALARALGMKTVAEGVESDAQCALVREIGCDAVQGYLIGKPGPAARIEPYAQTRFAPARASSLHDARS
jgi:diguanylate cyclase